MSIVQSGAKHRLRFNHRSGDDGARELLGVVIEERIPGDAPVQVVVDQPTTLPQTDAAQRSPLLDPFDNLQQPFVVEAAVRPTVTAAAGGTFNKRVPTLSVIPTAEGTFTKVANLPAWVAIGTSVITVVDYTLGATDTITLTPAGGSLITLTEGTDFNAATDNPTTAGNIVTALAAVGITAVATGAVIRITQPLDTLATGDATAWTVALAPGQLTPAIPAAGLVPKGRYNGFIPQWPEDTSADVPNSGHVPGGQLLRVRWLGTPVVAEVVVTGGAVTTFSEALANQDVAPGSVVITVTIGGNTLILRDDGAGNLHGYEATGGEYGNGTIDYRAGTVDVTLSSAADAVNITGDYEHSCLYQPLDVSLSWDAEMAQG